MFTDEDLEELKGRIPDLQKFRGYKIAISSQRLSDLLARLEAAEFLIPKSCGRCCRQDDTGLTKKRICRCVCHPNGWEAWRTAAGKDAK
jgi:hypothetical protein